MVKLLYEFGFLLLLLFLLIIILLLVLKENELFVHIYLLGHLITDLMTVKVIKCSTTRENFTKVV